MDRRRSSHIVPEIYEATINPDHWDYVVTMIAKLTRSKVACIYYINKDMAFTSTIAQYGLSEDQQTTIGDQVEKFDRMFLATSGKKSKALKFLQFHPVGEGILSPDSEIYQDWLEPGGHFYVGGAQFLNSSTYKSGVVILRNKASGPWDKGDTRVINDLLPHLQRAFNIHSEFTHLRLKQDALLKGLDRLVIGLILYNRQAKPVYINPTAKAIIKSHPALELSEGDLLLTNKEDEKNLRKTIIDTAEIDPDDSWKQSVAIGVTHPAVDAPLPLLVTPMHAHLITSDLDYEGARVAVFLSDPNLQQPISVESLVSVYNLTPSEAQVAISLANGHSIDEIANSSHHSTHTIRSQLKSVFRKTGVSRQSELIKMLLTGPFAHRRRSDSTQEQTELT